jgi:AcrR family transcriptional regulator
MIEAALDSLREEGYAAATARSIGARGGFNPALIFYHFGSVDDLFVAALERTSAVRLERYRSELSDVDGLGELVHHLRTLYAEDIDSAHIAALQELVAASAFSASVGKRVAALMEPWFDFSEELIDRSLRDRPLAGVFPARDLAFGMVALYLGLETMTRLRGCDQSRVASLFDTGERLVEAVTRLLGQRQRGTPGVRRVRKVKVE